MWGNAKGKKRGKIIESVTQYATATVGNQTALALDQVVGSDSCLYSKNTLGSHTHVYIGLCMGQARNCHHLSAVMYSLSTYMLCQLADFTQCQRCPI